MVGYAGWLCPFLRALAQVEWGGCSPSQYYFGQRSVGAIPGFGRSMWWSVADEPQELWAWHVGSGQ
jgi:hypothetical protein